MTYQDETLPLGTAGLEENAFPGRNCNSELTSKPRVIQEKFDPRSRLIAASSAKDWPVARLSRLADEAIARGAPIRRIPCVWHAPDVLTMVDCRSRLALARGCSQVRIGGAA